MQEKHLSDLKFSELDLHPKLVKGIEATGFKYCTPIQALALPLALKGEDVAGQAQTGTGKTIAFVLGTMQYLLNDAEKNNAAETPKAADVSNDTDTSAEDAKAGAEIEAGTDDNKPKQRPKRKPRGMPIGALILAPTRELAIQIHKDAAVLAEHAGLKIGLAYGGTGYDEQKAAIESGLDILIGTPGRVIDYFKKGVFHLEDLKVAVMDEADRMFDLGFVDDIRFLLRRMPKPDERLNLLFSATLSFRVDELAYEHMNAPTPVKVEAEMVVQRIEESAYYPAQDEKIKLLINLLNTLERERALVFINTKYEATKVSDWLEANGIQAATLSGDVPQVKREKLLAKFADGSIDILVATDVAARGLHIPNVSHVFNYDLPQDPEDYVHRSGRTARAGASGHAISFICEKYAYSMMDIEKYIGHALPIVPIDDALLIEPENKPAYRPREPRGGRGGRPNRNDRRTGGKPNNRTQGKPAHHAQSNEGKANDHKPADKAVQHASTPEKSGAEKPSTDKTSSTGSNASQTHENQTDRPQRARNNDTTAARAYSEYDDNLYENKPVVKPAIEPEDVPDSKYTEPASDHSIRFGDIPAVG
ncbi:MAG: DEAD/DEAH box helicase [Arenicellales bacterium]